MNITTTSTTDTREPVFNLLICRSFLRSLMKSNLLVPNSITSWFSTWPSSAAFWGEQVIEVLCQDKSTDKLLPDLLEKIVQMKEYHLLKQAEPEWQTRSSSIFYIKPCNMCLHCNICWASFTNKFHSAWTQINQSASPNLNHRNERPKYFYEALKEACSTSRCLDIALDNVFKCCNITDFTIILHWKHD